MILIADSGSTKTQWCLLTKSGQSEEFQTDGLNPFHQTVDGMKNSILNQLLPQISHLMWVGSIDKIYFYGAGCTPEKSPLVAQALQSCFRSTAQVHVEVYSDMVGAARALLGKEKGVVCILGTGSNSCLYDGEKFTKNVPALGFILGDEGSGAVLGRRLVSDLLKNQLSDELKQKFLEQYKTSQADIIENVYRKTFPSRYLAAFSRFCAENISNPLIYKLVCDHFDELAKRILKQYPPELEVGFVGSIAYYYQDVLKKVLADNGISCGKILQSPMPGLKKYHGA